MNRLGVLTLTCAAAALAAAAGAAEIGAVGAANELTTGQPPEQTARQLVIAQPVVVDERIVANDNGLAQIIFVDRTTLTVSPNSDVTLDRYVFDPDAGAGAIALTLTKGALRFIGGAISKTGEASIAAPGASIALRGALATVDTDTERTRVVLWAGDYARITAPGGVLTLSRPGAVGIVDLGDPAAAPRFDGVVRDVDAGAILGTFRSTGDGGVRTAGLAQPPDTAGALGGSSAAPVSTRGAVQLSDSLDAPEFERAALALGVQDTFYSSPDRTPPLNMDIIDVGGEGVVRGQLIWQTQADLDLHLILPDGAGEVFFGNKSVQFNEERALAVLDVDNLGSPTPDLPAGVPSDSRIENIRVTGTDVPEGRYVFFVRQFDSNGSASNPFSLTATGDNGGSFSRIEDVLTDSKRESERLPVDYRKGGGGSSPGLVGD